MIRVGVFGAAGRMGAAVCRAVLDDPDLELAAAVDPFHADTDLDQIGIHGSGIWIAGHPDVMRDANVDVAVDFTALAAARENLAWCATNGVHAVVGTTGFSPEDLDRFRDQFEASAANALIAPNFAIGAVLMMRFAEMAAPYFESAEVIELHHEAKTDAPSGTAMLTVARMAAASDVWARDPTTTVVVPGARGGEGAAGIRIHSVRLRGMVAHQEVLLGTTGQSLSIRHDSYDRTSFMPGVVLAIRRIQERPGLTIGLDTLLGL